MAEQLTIAPPAALDSLSATQTPLVTEGRLSFNEARAIADSSEGYYIPIDGWGRQLSPMETGTDVALPIVSANNGLKRPSAHHAYFYKRHYVGGVAAVQAVRHSRLQQTNDPAAHKMYHAHYSGTLMPRDEAAAVRTVILNSAGYVPHLGVVVRGDNVNIRELSPRERNRLREPKVFTLDRSCCDRIKVGRFLMDYALKQNLDDVKEAQVEEFVELTLRKKNDERSRARKLRLGLRLTNIAISMAVDPVEPDYRSARRDYALRKGTPRTAWHRVKELLQNREVDYIPTLEDRLVDAHYAFN